MISEPKLGLRFLSSPSNDSAVALAPGPPVFFLIAGVFFLCVRATARHQLLLLPVQCHRHQPLLHPRKKILYAYVCILVLYVYLLVILLSPSTRNLFLALSYLIQYVINSRYLFFTHNLFLAQRIIIFLIQCQKLKMRTTNKYVIYLSWFKRGVRLHLHAVKLYNW
jgi:hypothetical protein